jgi:hypothetical protein
LLVKLAKRKVDLTTPALRDNLLHFYSDLSVAIETKKDKDRWQNALAALGDLKLMTSVRTLAANPTK